MQEFNFSAKRHSRQTHPAVMMSGSCGVLGAIFTVTDSKSMSSLLTRMVYVPAVMFSNRKEPSSLLRTVRTQRYTVSVYTYRKG